MAKRAKGVRPAQRGHDGPGAGAQPNARFASQARISAAESLRRKCDRRRDASAASWRLAMDACEGSAAQERVVSPEHQPYQVLEDRLLDLGAVEHQGGAIEAIDVDQRHRHFSGLVVDAEHYR